MILDFCATNYLSIKEELRLSFVATPLKENGQAANSVYALSDTGVSLLRTAIPTVLQGHLGQDVVELG